MKTNPNDGAFAASDDYTGDGKVKQGGLTKREYFAVMAMQGLCGSYEVGYEAPDSGNQVKFVASLAVECADALIEELNKTAAI